MTNNNPPKEGLPAWATGILVACRLVGFVILVAAGFSLRLLRRADPVLALVICLSLCVGLVLMFGIGYYAQAVLVDLRRGRPSKRLGAIRVAAGFLLSLPLFLGFRTEDAPIKLAENLTIGVLPAIEYGWSAAAWFALPVAVGIQELIAGAVALQGVQVPRKAGVGILVAGLAASLLLGVTFRPSHRVAVIQVGDRPGWEEMRLGTEGRYLAGSRRGTITVWDTVTDKTVFQQEPPESMRASGVTFYNADGALMAQDDWPLRAQRIAFSPNGQQLAVCYANGVVTAWSLSSPGEKVLSVETDAATIRQHDDSGASFDVLEKSRRLSDFRYSSDGKRLLLVTGQKLSSVDAATGAVEPLFEFPEPAEIAVVSADFSHVAAGSVLKEGRKKTAKVRVWSVEDGELVSQFSKDYQKLNALALGPKGTRLVCALDDYTTLLDCSSGEELWSTDYSEWDSVTGASVDARGEHVLLSGVPPKVRSAFDGDVVYRFRQFADDLSGSQRRIVDWSTPLSHVAVGCKDEVHVWRVDRLATH